MAVQENVSSLAKPKGVQKADCSSNGDVDLVSSSGEREAMLRGR